MATSWSTIDGELTMLGITKPVSLKVTNFACGEHPFNKKPMCGAEATTTIKRSEWGMKYGIPKAVGDDVRITCRSKRIANRSSR